MKATKKICSAALVFTLVLGSGFSAFAAEPNQKNDTPSNVQSTVTKSDQKSDASSDGQNTTVKPEQKNGASADEQSAATKSDQKNDGSANGETTAADPDQKSDTSTDAAVAAKPDQNSGVPSDVQGTAYEAAVKNLTEADILSGYPDGLFHPDNTVNRAEACVMVVKAMKPGSAALKEAGTSLFNDMGNYGWAAPYVNYAVSRGIVSGYGDNQFHPDQPVTYTEAAAMMINAMGYTASDLKGTWPNNYVDKARNIGLFQTVGNSSALNIKANANRGDFANMLNSVTQEIAKADVKPVEKQEDAKLDPRLNDGSPQAKTLEEAKDSIVPTMAFTGTPLNLSLDDAIKMMQTTGPGFQAAVLQKQSTLASSLSKGEAWSALNSAKKLSKILPDSLKPDSLKDIDLSGMDQADLASTYLLEKAPVDYQAAMNQLESTAVQSYYQVLLAQENYRIEQENLQVQKDLLKNTQKKFEQGVAAKIDVISAQTALESAKSSAESVLTKVNLAKMNFNIQLNYPLMQSVNLTDPLEKVAAPTQTLTVAISSALNHRHELKDVKFSVDLNKLAVATIGIRYPSSSATYKTAEVALLQAQKTYDDAVKQIEMDIRNRFMQLGDDTNAIASAKATLDNAKEGFRITSLSYDAGVKTLTDVQEMQVKVYQAELQLASKINDYDLQVYALRYATDVGVGGSDSSAR